MMLPPPGNMCELAEQVEAGEAEVARVEPTFSEASDSLLRLCGELAAKRGGGAAVLRREVLASDELAFDYWLKSRPADSLAERATGLCDAGRLVSPELLPPPRTPPATFAPRRRSGGEARARQKKIMRCGVCSACEAPNCGACRFCLDMRKHGGAGTLRQPCLQRRCTSKASDGEVPAPAGVAGCPMDFCGSSSLAPVPTPAPPPQQWQWAPTQQYESHRERAQQHALQQQWLPQQRLSQPCALVQELLGVTQPQWALPLQHQIPSRGFEHYGASSSCAVPLVSLMQHQALPLVLEQQQQQLPPREQRHPHHNGAQPAIPVVSAPANAGLTLVEMTGVPR